MKLSTRQHEIISYIASCEGFVTADNIAGKLGISSRTVKRELAEIDMFLNSVGVVFHRKTGSGVKIAGGKSELELLSDILSKKTIPVFSQSKRVLAITLSLLFSDDPIKRFFFATKLGVSELTISADLAKCEEILEAQNIKLVKKQGYGIYVVCDEEDRRSGIYHAINEATLGLSVAEISSRTLEEYIDKSRLSDISKMLSHVHQETPLYQSDRARDNLALHAYIMLERISLGNKVPIKDRNVSKDLWQVSASILEKLQSSFSGHITNGEVEYFATVLKSAPGLSFSGEKKEADIARRIAEIFARKIGSELGVIIDVENEFFQSLIRHLVLLVNRNQNHASVINPILDEIKNNYKSQFEMTQRCCKEIFSEMGIEFSQSEIGYLTLHLSVIIEDGRNKSKPKATAIVVCPSGLVLSQLLALSIKREFSEIDVIKTSSSADIQKEIEDCNPNFIISTKHLDTGNIPLAVVSPFLQEEDKQIISSMLENHNWRKHTKEIDRIEQNISKYQQDKAESANALAHILESMVVWENQDISSTLQLVELVSNHFGKSQTQVAEIKADLLAREEIGSTIMTDDEMMLLHARTDGTKTPCFAIVKSTKPIKAGLENLKTAMVMLTPKDSSRNVVKFFNVISQTLVLDEEFYDGLKTKSSAEIENLAKTLLYNYYYSKYND